jgi:hypothetical protein
MVAYGADAVLASPIVEIGSPQVEFIKSAKRLAIPSAVAVASWDNLTSKGLLRVIPDRVIVWNDIQRRELEEMHGVSKDCIVTVTGAQKFDPWFDREPSTSYEEFTASIGLDSDKPYVLYTCSSAFIAPNEVDFVRGWVRTLRASRDPRIGELGIVVRPHPQNATPWATADLSEFPNLVIWPREGAAPDAGEAQRLFFDCIHHSVSVVGINTSAQIDAAIVGRPVYTVRAFAASQDGTVHFHYLLHENGGFVRDASSLDDHVKQLAAGLDNPGARAKEIENFVATFIRPRGVSRAVAPMVADEIEELARQAVCASKPGARTLALRILLYPVAGVLALASMPTAMRNLRSERGDKMNSGPATREALHNSRVDLPK